MRNWLKSKEATKMGIIIVILCVVLSVQILGFFHFNKKLYNMSLDHTTQQVNELSFFVEKNFRLELNSHIRSLELIESQLSVTDQPCLKDIIHTLHSLHRSSDFRLMGVSNLDGVGVDSSGRNYTIHYPNIQDSIEKGNVYISNILKSENDTLVFIAVPLHIQGEISGILWGKYPLSNIMDTLEFTSDSYKYFQIIDDKGNYLLSTQTVFSLNEKHKYPHETIWEELECYEYRDGMSTEKIQQKVQNGERGNFYFEDGGEGRYVSFRPLGINNWYLFSVQEDEGLHEYVGHTRRIAVHLFILLTIGLLIIFGSIYNLIYTMYKKISMQNHEMERINIMFRAILAQTKNIPFTIDHKLKQVILYGYPSKNVMQRCTFSDMDTESMLKKGLLDKSSKQDYEKLYQSLIVENKRCDPVIIYCQMGDHKQWIRVSLTDELPENPYQMIGVLEDYSEHKKKELQIETHLDDIKKISKRSQIDFLTGVYNREAFLQKMQTALDATFTNEQTSALLIIDLDYFKEVNDTMGHGMGDFVLQKTATTLRNFFRKEDVVGRLGGDEFVVFAQNIRDVDAFKIRLKKLNHLLCKIYHKNGKSVTVSASIGIKITDAEHTTFNVLYEKADQALYNVKQRGRNDFRLYRDLQNKGS